MKIRSPFSTPYLSPGLEVGNLLANRSVIGLVANFVLDLPGGGGKHLACSFGSYDRDTGVSTFRAPVLTNNEDKAGKVYKYYDPIRYTS
jgi:hypothetical protein